MRVDCLERLRCPADHGPSPLITLATHRDGEHVTDGVLGCPACGAEYPIRHGVACLGEPPADLDGANDTVADHPDPWRLAALLDLTTPSRRLLLAGTWSAVAEALQEATEARCLVLNAPPSSYRMGADAPDAVTVPAGSPFPLSDATLDGLVLDGHHVVLLADAARVLRPGGRLVAPVTAPLPDGCRELARDGALWVATVEATSTVSQPIPLRRQSPPSA